MVEDFDSRHRATRKSVAAVTVFFSQLLAGIQHASAEARNPNCTASTADTSVVRATLLDQNIDALNFVLWHFFAIVLLVIAIILLLRISGVKKFGRFLQHLAGAYAVVAAGHFGAITAAVFKERIAMNGLISAATTPDSICNTIDAIKLIEINWEAVDLSLSFFSTFWLILTWDLIKEYPKQGISKQFFVVAAAVLALVIGLPTLLLTALTDKASALLQVLDAVSSAFALSLVGLALSGMYPRNLPIASNRRFWLLQLATGLLYLAWGIANLFYGFLHHRLLFEIILFSLGFIAVLLTMILCASIMEDKPEFAVASASQ